MAEKKNVYGILLGKPEGQNPLGRPKPSWDVKVNIDLEVGLIL
jgi:hypothetical protein